MVDISLKEKIELLVKTSVDNFDGKNSSNLKRIVLYTCYKKGLGILLLFLIILKIAFIMSEIKPLTEVSGMILAF